MTTKLKIKTWYYLKIEHSCTAKETKECMIELDPLKPGKTLKLYYKKYILILTYGKIYFSV
jgi:hypothetical protein